YPDLIENGAAPGADRSKEFQRVVWHLAAQGWSAEQIAEELAKYPNGIGAKYAGRLLAEVTRSYEKWRVKTGGASVSPATGSGAGSATGSGTGSGATGSGAAAGSGAALGQWWLRFCQCDSKGRPLSN